MGFWDEIQVYYKNTPTATSTRASANPARSAVAAQTSVVLDAHVLFWHVSRPHDDMQFHVHVMGAHTASQPVHTGGSGLHCVSHAGHSLATASVELAKKGHTVVHVKRTNDGHVAPMPHWMLQSGAVHAGSHSGAPHAHVKSEAGLLYSTSGT